MIVLTKKQQKLMKQLKNTNSETYFHCIHVKNLTVKMLKLMIKEGFVDYSPEEIDAISKGALLHDIGKLFVGNNVLTKDSKLTKEEWLGMAGHTVKGFDAVKDDLTVNESEIIENICRYHHERIDGSGYEGKTDIPVYVQVVSVCDVFDAVHMDRVYRKGLSYEKTMEIISDKNNKYFDKKIVEYLKRVTQ